MLYPSRKGKNDPKGSSEVDRSATGTTGLKGIGPGAIGEVVSSLVPGGRAAGQGPGPRGVAVTPVDQKDKS